MSEPEDAPALSDSANRLPPEVSAPRYTLPAHDLPIDGIEVGAEVDADGEARFTFRIDLVKLIEAMSNSSKRRGGTDRPDGHRELALLWEHFSALVEGVLQAARERGLDDEDIRDLRTQLDKLRRLLRRIRRALDRGDQAEADRLFEEARDAGEEIESILND